MIILHAAMGAEQLTVWGEALPEDGKRPRRARRSSTQTSACRPLPWAAGKTDLRSALAQAGIGAPAATGGSKKRPGLAMQTAVLWLPTAEGVPLEPSAAATDSTEPALAPWAVTACSLGADDAIALLCACADSHILTPGVLVGDDMAFWAAAMRFAGAVVVRQEYLPSLRKVGEAYRALWQPVFTVQDRERLLTLSHAMPGVARALTDDDAQAPPDLPAISTLTRFVELVVDRLVRGYAPAAPAHKPQALDSLHEQWLHALRSPTGELLGTEAELSAFARQVDEWASPVTTAAEAPFHLCFRLEEPDDDEDEIADTARLVSPASLTGTWHLRYLLQAADDPSLLVPAEDAWKARSKKAALLKREGFSPKEYLLRSLGEASRLSKPVDHSLRDAAPSGCELDGTGAHEFLTQTAAALEQAGFSVLLPAWWTRTGTKLQVSARAKARSPQMQGARGISLDEMLAVDWEIVLGGDTLTLEQLQELAKLKSPLVKLRGQWVQVSAETIAAAAEFWQRRSGEELAARDVLRMALGATEHTGALPFEGVVAGGWVDELLQRLQDHAKIEQLASPQGFSGSLRPYQVRGLSWLAFLGQWGLGACLADDMGLGKTIQMLAMVQRTWESNGKRPTLLVCPTSVVGNWQKEAARFTPDLPVMLHHGGERSKGEEFARQASRHALVISSYALLYRDAEDLQSINWSGVVLDEAQNVKNPQTRQAQAARSLHSDYRVALTGTPVENNVGDLWSIMEFLNPGLLGSQASFKRTFFVPIQANRDPRAADTLKRLTGPFILRRLKTDRSIISDLPEKLEMKVFCNLTREQASLYAAVTEETEKALAGAEGIERRGLVLATLSKLKQVCNHPAQLLGDGSPLPGRSGKLARLTEMVDELLAVGDRALVFSQFAEMGGMIRRHLQGQLGCEVLFLHGAVPQKQREAMVERFQTEDGPPVFVLSLKAGGSGLNLTAANHVFHFDRWWNPAVENQATDRAFRIGQTKNVQVHKFLCVGTLEERLDEMIEQKKEVAEWVVGTGEGWVTELSNDELKELFALRESAVGD